VQDKLNEGAMMQAWLNIFPEKLQAPLQQGHQLLNGYTEEIRLRVGQPLMIIGDSRTLIWKARTWQIATDAAYSLVAAADVLQSQDLEMVFDRVCQGSLYALEEELKNGFLTVPGGHRLGFSGRAVLVEGQLQTLKDIRFMNLRIARQVKHCLHELLPFLTCEGRWLSSLIISPPLGGKTTILRELVRLASSGIGVIEGYHGKPIGGMNVSLVDERSELAGSYLGAPQFDLGPRTDVLDGCPKAQGMMLMIRSMAPQILAVDEIGRSQDFEALYHALACGIIVFATIHGIDISDIYQRPGWQKLIESKLFQRILVLKGYGSQRQKPIIYDGVNLERIY
jgi:stage III sporulation protein AA